MSRLVLMIIAMASSAVLAFAALTQPPQPLPSQSTAPKKPLQGFQPPPEPKLMTFEAPKPLPNDSELRKLMKERLAAALAELRLTNKMVSAGNWDLGTLSNLLNAIPSRIFSSYLALEPTREERIIMLTYLLEVAQQYETILKSRFNVGSIREQEYQQAVYYRADAEIRLLQAKQEPAKSGNQPKVDVQLEWLSNDCRDGDRVHRRILPLRK